MLFIEIKEVIENDEKYKVMLENQEKLIETQTSKINSFEENNKLLKKELTGEYLSICLPKESLNSKEITTTVIRNIF